MMTDDRLAQEFSKMVEQFYPTAGELLHRCYVMVITSYWGKPPQRLRHIGIYCSDEMIRSVEAKKEAFRDVAYNLGLTDVVCINATRLLRDPLSKIKRENWRFWLELHWIVSQ
jgi:hypothetical protein